MLPDDCIGNYRIERHLGSTTHGELYQALHTLLPRRVVIKVARAGVVASSASTAAMQLLREGCILEALNHDGVPQIFESGLLDDRRPWTAVERVEGVTLVERIMRGPLSPLEAMQLVRDIAAILEHAHRRGVLHGGLRPDRIVLTSHRRFPLCIPDWSDARTHDAAPAIPRLPAPQSRVYMAPELIRGDAADDRADIYALGVIAFLALTGKHPDGTRTPGPRELVALVDQMLSVDRYDRPSAAEVRADLEWLIQAIPVEDIALVDTDGIPAPILVTEPTLPRIRKPKWTPAIPVDTRVDGVVAGEIVMARLKRS